MDVRVEALSHGLMDLGIEKGDRVAVVMGNCRWAFSSYFFLFELNTNEIWVVV